MRYVGWTAAALVAMAGCQGNPPRFDPFMGPSTVPPPATGGAILLPPGDPYAPQPAPLAPQAPPFVPQNSAPSVAPPFAPAPAPAAPPVSGGLQYRQSSVTMPAAASEGRMVPIQASAATGPEPSASASRVEPASFQAPVESAAAPSDEGDRYAHDAQYTRLRGQLDYSAIDRLWRLRYIPLSAEMDDHGGSVRLKEHPALSDRKPGDFVEVTGAIETQPTDDDYAPLYRLSSVTPLPP